MRKREIKCRAFVDARFRPGASAVARYDPADIRETNSGAIELGCPVQSLKNPKEFVGICHVESDAIVADREDCFAGFRIFMAANDDSWG